MQYRASRKSSVKTRTLMSLVTLYARATADAKNEKMCKNCAKNEKCIPTLATQQFRTFLAQGQLCKIRPRTLLFVRNSFRRSLSACAKVRRMVRPKVVLCVVEWLVLSGVRLRSLRGSRESREPVRSNNLCLFSIRTESALHITCIHLHTV